MDKRTNHCSILTLYSHLGFGEECPPHERKALRKIIDSYYKFHKLSGENIDEAKALAVRFCEENNRGEEFWGEGMFPSWRHEKDEITLTLGRMFLYKKKELRKVSKTPEQARVEQPIFQPREGQSSPILAIPGSLLPRVSGEDDLITSYIMTLDPVNHHHPILGFTDEWMAIIDASNSSASGTVWPIAADGILELFMHEHNWYNGRSDEDIKTTALIKKLRRGTELAHRDSSFNARTFRDQVILRSEALAVKFWRLGLLEQDGNDIWKTIEFEERWNARPFKKPEIRNTYYYDGIPHIDGTENRLWLPPSIIRKRRSTIVADEGEADVQNEHARGTPKTTGFGRMTLEETADDITSPKRQKTDIRSEGSASEVVIAELDDNLLEANNMRAIAKLLTPQFIEGPRPDYNFKLCTLEPVTFTPIFKLPNSALTRSATWPSTEIVGHTYPVLELDAARDLQVGGLTYPKSPIGPTTMNRFPKFTSNIQIPSLTKRSAIRCEFMSLSHSSTASTFNPNTHPHTLQDPPITTPDHISKSIPISTLISDPNTHASNLSIHLHTL
ncbi:hypothetical protein B7494_g6195 [Chlorociboria aeruginascens]|nr:hypothetical protein B7494_g6195 [Chlorociboria aeruginascens]